MITVLIVAHPTIGDRLAQRISAVPHANVTVASVGDVRAAIADAATSIDYVILHDAPLRGTTSMDGDHLHELVREIRTSRPRLPIAVLLDSVRGDDLKKAVFVPSVDIGLDLGEEHQRLDAAIDRIVTRITELGSHSAAMPSGAHRIGSLVEVEFDGHNSGDAASNRPGTAYRMARWRSLMPVDGSDFARNVRDVVGALSRFPLRTNLPWNPLDHSPASKGKTHALERPQLRDVMRAFASDDAVKRLFGSKPPPVNRAEAQDLLSGKRHRDEDEDEYERWWRVWEHGTHPPAVLLDGETGVGKTLMAEFITFLLTPTRTEGARQGLSSRSRFVRANAAGLTLSDFNHQLMGVAPGVWSGIDDAVVGRLARAAHGVFFLDEIGDMPRDLQAAVLTFLDSREIHPTGINPFLGYQHIIAATNKRLNQEVASGAFRQDLLARFPVRLTIPPLRERAADERERWVDFLAQDPIVNPRIDGTEYEITHIDRAAVDRLVEHDYRNGNFRELTERVHEAIRSARRHLRRIVILDDVLPPAAPLESPNGAKTP